MALPFFGIGMTMDFSSPVATAELSKFAGILSITLSQHHLLGFKIAQLEFWTPLVAQLVKNQRAMPET